MFRNIPSAPTLQLYNYKAKQWQELDKLPETIREWQPFIYQNETAQKFFLSLCNIRESPTVAAVEIFSFYLGIKESLSHV